MAECPKCHEQASLFYEGLCVKCEPPVSFAQEGGKVIVTHHRVELAPVLTGLPANAQEGVKPNSVSD